jgi:hypothetical protein
MLPVPRPPSLRSGFRAGSLAVVIASRAFSRRMRSSLTSHKTSTGLLRIGGQEQRRRSDYIELSARRCTRGRHRSLKLPTVMAKHHVKQNEKEKPHWSAEAWSQVRVEFRRALALRSEIRRAGWFNELSRPAFFGRWQVLRDRERA